MTIQHIKAKPYAKAIFNLALEQDQLLLWQEKLEELAKVAIECEKNKLLNNPRITALGKISFFADIIKGKPEAISNLIKLLIERKKLILLPDIAADYRQLFFAHNNILEVTVISAYKLVAEQKKQLLSALKKRYRQEIVLKHYIDIALIGGAVLRVGDKVIDGSVRGMLQRLKQNLLLKSIYA
jgi:F-type H+-transporting ATPase subunit delta